MGGGHYLGVGERRNAIALHTAVEDFVERDRAGEIETDSGGLAAAASCQGGRDNRHADER